MKRTQKRIAANGRDGRRGRLVHLDDRGPLRVMFVITSMPVGGAETLLVDLIRGLDRERFRPELCCLKSLGPLGEVLATEIPATENMLRHKYDVRVAARLVRLFRRRRVDAVVTVGAGDKMFWGRLAARWAGVPVIASALHSTGWPDQIGRLNRLLTRWTDAFVAVAPAHGQFLIEQERFPAHKVRVIPNGVDVRRFRRPVDVPAVRAEIGVPPTACVAGIVAALRSEKNHALLLEAWSRVQQRLPESRLLFVGDGPERPALESLADRLGIAHSVRFLGTRHDVPELLAAIDVFVLTSRMEANPVSILEAMAAGKPIVAPRIGSIPDVVRDQVSGYLTQPGDAAEVADRLGELLGNAELRAAMGAIGQQTVTERWSLPVMIRGYEQMLAQIYSWKCEAQGRARRRAIRQTAGAAGCQVSPASPEGPNSAPN